MTTEWFDFEGFEATTLPGVLWLPEDEPKCLLQITHGMTEHMGRYQSLAEKLTARGIAVAGFDLRGHGRNPGRHIAAFAEADWERSIQDMALFRWQLSRRFPDIPCFLHGFSLGSFLARDYLGRYPEDFSGAVILGTGNQPSWIMAVMKTIVLTQVKKVGWEQGSALVKQLSFESYNRKFRPNRTELDWLCADGALLDDYLADPLCRREISTGLFYQMLEAMAWTGKGRSIQSWNKAMPVLLLSGDQDPVGNMGKGVLAVKRQLENGGMERVTCRLLPGQRHMITDNSSGYIVEFIESN